ncbi:uncharacterized protein LOC132613045 [Lycium barbarum]|uniref:uncharacterized protein LOC132613045 n=1 Tax=Lycium barbarum TaxID=112863 RepID=UPI00293E6C7E|nr:uncharacterized protein LOC132613045 [Lycium barbarum]
MALFEALYKRICRSPIGWSDAFEMSPRGTDLLRELLDKVKIQEKPLAAQSRKKVHMDQQVRDLKFMVGDQVLLKVSPMKGVMRFGEKGKLNLRFIGPFEILLGEVPYQLALPLGLWGVHSVFHMSMMKKYHSDESYIIYWDSVLFDQNLSFEEEPVAILERNV